MKRFLVILLVASLLAAPGCATLGAIAIGAAEMGEGAKQLIRGAGYVVGAVVGKESVEETDESQDGVSTGDTQH